MLKPGAVGMLIKIRINWILALFLFVSSHGAVAEEPRPQFNCGDPLKTVPGAINYTLGELYHGESSAEKLLAASDELRQLVSVAIDCRVYAQSPSSGSPQELVTEWYGLNLWINRLADFVYLNAKGKNHVDWKVEYAEFAELYEFEI